MKIVTCHQCYVYASVISYMFSEERLMCMMRKHDNNNNGDGIVIAIVAAEITIRKNIFTTADDNNHQ